MSTTRKCDVLVVGSGAAGLTLALQVPDKYQVIVLSKGEVNSGSTWLAQGGIAAVLDESDNVRNHESDTMIAGAWLSQKKAVRHTVENGPDSVRWLVNQGVPFTEHDGQFHLTREGGHSHRRIIHADDATGKAVHRTLISRVEAAQNITLATQITAIDLITLEKLGLAGKRCVGVYALNNKTGHVESIEAKHIVLATGGAAKAYLYTSNSDGATGDGIAMAWRAGCRVANMEFNQFHPTCLYHPQAKSFLITEAVRGEGGRLLLPSGERFMSRFDERAELAPRDIVARAIDHEMKRLGCDCVFLDISHKPASFIKEHFPTIYRKCLKFGIDITKEAIPVVPAAHYSCGGVITSLDGHTDLPGLYAIGETAFTGLHGANRLASNSLLECLVYGRSAAHSIIEQLDRQANEEPELAIPEWDESQVTNSDEDVIIAHNWDELRRFMWDYVGIVRSTKRLQRAKHRVDLLLLEIDEYYSNYRISKDLLELRNLAVVSDLIIRSASSRKESRGLHYNIDFPDLAPETRDTVLTPENFRWDGRD